MGDISLLIIAICMAILLIFVIVLIISLVVLVRKIGKNITSLEIKVTPLIEEATKSIEETRKTLVNTTAITANLKSKIDEASPLFSSIAKIGSIADHYVSKFSSKHSVNGSFFASEDSSDSSSLNDWVECAGLGLILFKKIKERMEK